MLTDRFECSNYASRKIQENIECEIMQVVLDEARETFTRLSILELQNDSEEEMCSNIDVIARFIIQWPSSAFDEPEE